MHPNSAFRPALPADEERALCESLIAQIGFGTVFAATPDGLRAAHTPLLSTGDGAVQFHLARGNAMTRRLDGTTALAMVNGPDAYVSPRWYENSAQVPTWNYVALEIEGRARRMDADGLHGLLDALTRQHEARLGEDERWDITDMPAGELRANMAHIVGFEIEVLAWRPTLKLSQNKSTEDRARVIAALEEHGSLAMAQLMKTFAP